MRWSKVINNVRRCDYCNTRKVVTVPVIIWGETFHVCKACHELMGDKGELDMGDVYD